MNGPNLLFVYGTLKRGFPLHWAINGVPYVGPYRTVDRYPLFVAGPRYAPMMLDEPRNRAPCQWRAVSYYHPSPWLPR